MAGAQSELSRNPNTDMKESLTFHQLANCVFLLFIHTMSLNWAMMSSDGRTPIPLPSEKLFFQQDKVKMVLDCNENGYPGNTRGLWEAKGFVALSNQRITFSADKPTEEFQTLNIPITQFKRWKLEQPWFGANYITGTVLPTPGGGLPGPGNVTLTFTEGGATEFTTILHGLLERMGESESGHPQHYEPLPAYEAQGSHTMYPPPSASYPQPEASSATTYPPPTSYPPPDTAYPPLATAYPPPATAYSPPATAYPPPAATYPSPDTGHPASTGFPNDAPPSYNDLHRS